MLAENVDDARLGADKLTAKLITLKTKVQGIRNLQKMSAPLKRLRNFYRYQVVIWLDIESENDLMPLIYQIANDGNTDRVTVFTEINPQQML